MAGQPHPLHEAYSRERTVAEHYSRNADRGRRRPGIAIAPRSLWCSFNWPDVVYVPVTGPPTTELTLAWRTTVASDAVAKFIDTARLAAVRSQ